MTETAQDNVQDLVASTPQEDNVAPTPQEALLVALRIVDDLGKALASLGLRHVPAPESKGTAPESKGRAGSRSMQEYRDMGYTPKEPSPLLNDFIEEYADQGRHEGDKHPGCVADCIEICQINALEDLEDLRMLARRCWLGDYFPAKVALRFENALESPEMLYVFNKLDEGNKKPWAGTFHFTYKIESMETACATYGILSALLLTMNVGSFGNIQIEEWGAYESGVAMERCNGTSLWSWSSGRPGETVEECITALSAESEKWFVASNYGACLFLMLTLLLSSWLYISFGIPGADRTRPDEVQAVVARLSGEFATLNVLFLLSVALSGTGLIQLVQIKSKRAARPCR